MDLFSQATEVKTTNGKANNKEYEEVILKEEDFPQISNQLERLQKVRDDLADNKAMEGTLSGLVKEIAVEQYVRLYNLSGTNPKTFIIRGELGGSFMVQVTDKYKTIDAERAKELSSKYGNESVETETTYIFNPVILNKEGNMDKISRALMNSDLTDEEKRSIIQTKVSHAVKKGFIDKLATTENVGQTFKDVQPVVALKNYR